MSTIRVILCLVCFAVIGSAGLFNRHLLANSRDLGSVSKASRSTVNNFGANPSGAILICRQKLVHIAQKEVGIREKTGKNDGSRIEEYLAAVKLKRGNPYCAAFLSWIYMQEGFAKPRSGWSPDLVPRSRLTHDALPANIFGIYYPELRRIAHVGMIESVQHSWAVTLEANTNVAGSREGEGVYRKRRHLKTIPRMADWILPERRTQ